MSVHASRQPDSGTVLIWNDAAEHMRITDDEGEELLDLLIDLLPVPEDDLPGLPSFEKDPIAQHFGFVDGVPACNAFPCEHGWDDRPSLVEVVAQRDTFRAILVEARQELSLWGWTNRASSPQEPRVIEMLARIDAVLNPTDVAS